MTDPTTSLGPISPIKCPRPDCYWSVHGIPDRYTAARAETLAAHLDEDHDNPTEGAGGAPGAPERTDPSGALAGHQTATESSGSLSARWARREQLDVLLSRMSRGVLLDSERGLLRAAVETELADAENAHQELALTRRRLEITRDALDIARTPRPQEDTP